MATRIMRFIEERSVDPGERIPTEVEISAYFGTSRQRVREGLRHLEALGILQARQGSGRTLVERDDYSLSALLSEEVSRSIADILNLLSVRQILEVGFLPQVVSTIDADGIAQIRAAIVRMAERVAMGERSAAEDRLFHQAVFRCVRNPLLLELVGRFWDLFERIDPSVFNHTESADDYVRHHERILDAIERRDAPLAQHYMNAHFYDVVAILETMEPAHFRALLTNR